jgi:hypothetical protein
MCHHKAEADVLHILPSDCWALQDKSSNNNISEQMAAIDATNLSQLLQNNLQTKKPITNRKETKILGPKVWLEITMLSRKKSSEPYKCVKLM